MRHLRGYLERAAQERLLQEIVIVLAQAPLFTPAMPRTGRPFSVQMSNCGPLGWVSDKAGGYRYQPAHPLTGEPWPPIPGALLALWAELSGYAAPPEACLINYYEPGARMGLHRDEDEEALDAPVISISLGDEALFRLGGLQRRAPTRSFPLASGDVVVLEGRSRLAYHGIDRIEAGSSDLLAPYFPRGGRINVTLRRVRPASHPAGSPS
ncbi:MAG: alpha-ketoglutarate-dependent dioxygenase AlkB [Alphaproteobacteria bacterium]|nr:MAG: alpha-ketoglutarate-dependent dioxygenase AlkB [Alphaproteobacteria bacterium]